MFYVPRCGDIRYVKKLVLFPISINGTRYAWQIIYMKQIHGICYWHDDVVVNKDTYQRWKKGR